MEPCVEIKKYMRHNDPSALGGSDMSLAHFFDQEFLCSLCHPQLKMCISISHEVFDDVFGEMSLSGEEEEWWLGAQEEDEEYDSNSTSSDEECMCGARLDPTLLCLCGEKTSSTTEPPAGDP